MPKRKISGRGHVTNNNVNVVVSRAKKPRAVPFLHTERICLARIGSLIEESDCDFWWLNLYPEWTITLITNDSVSLNLQLRAPDSHPNQCWATHHCMINCRFSMSVFWEFFRTYIGINCKAFPVWVQRNAANNGWNNATVSSPCVLDHLGFWTMHVGTHFLDTEINKNTHIVY